MTWFDKGGLSLSSVSGNRSHMLMKGLGRDLVMNPIFLTYTHLRMGDKRCVDNVDETSRRMTKRKKRRGRWVQVRSSCVSSH